MATKKPNNNDRIRSIAKKLCMTPTDKVAVVRDGHDWWLIGCVEGDTILPNVRGLWGLGDVLDQVESWLRVQERRKGK